ncbi:MAG: NAD kinase [Salinivirgaceae bacterium]|nr:MAG: NAD kinase [Salinivirgaceae bacterium]
MKIGLYSRKVSHSFYPKFIEIIHFLLDQGVDLQVYKSVLDQVSKDLNNQNNIETFESKNEINKDLDLMISIGGDGTFLETVTYIQDLDIPILGINSGRLGFLADIAPDDIFPALKEVCNSNFQVENRSLIEMESSEKLDCDFNYALNDFTIRKSDRATLIKIHTWINGEFLNSYWADGLIVSTPTGSTAYSMSVGGPIVVPESNNFIISPIASHNLTVRPLVVSADHEIKLTVESRTNMHIASLDARSFFFKKNVEFLLRKSSFTIRVAKIYNHSYFSTIRNKLMWGIDKRN